MEMYEMNNFSRKQTMKGLRELVTDIDHLKSLEKLKKVNQDQLYF